MDYDTENFDCDPADCNCNAACSCEFDSETAEEFTETPNEFSVDADTEAASEFGVEPTETDVVGTYPTPVPYPVVGSDETASVDAVNNVNEPIGAPDVFVDPSDETAATSDELYTTTLAQQRCALDDYEIISDVLGGEKQLVKLYSTALCEASEENLRDIIRENLVECAADQYSTFEYMEKRGMYPTEQADESAITQAKQQFGPLCHCCNCEN